MIKKLKTKFIILVMLSLFVLLAVIITGMNVINYNSVVADSDMLLNVLSQNRGEFPETNDKHDDDKLPPRFSPETPYESRYFSVVLNQSNEVTDINTSRITSVNEQSAAEFAEIAVSKNKSQGFINKYRYTIHNEMGITRIYFLDCDREIDSFTDFLFISISMALAGYAVVFIIIFIMSGKIINPIVESYEKQKRFITDAGHEIKTPLTIINANADILEMEIGEENESLQDIKNQAKRLKNLTEELVMLSRMEEADADIQKIEFPISEVVCEAANAFRPIMLNENKEFVCNIESLLTLYGNDKSVRQLVSVFLDNAVKYTPSGGKIAITLSKQSRTIILSVYNTTDVPVQADRLKYVFDRFYRTDNSRNSETGGHGIGLSIAKAIVVSHDGKIKASTDDGKSFTVTASFPV